MWVSQKIKIMKISCNYYTMNQAPILSYINIKKYCFAIGPFDLAYEPWNRVDLSPNVRYL